jgi:2-polyprenyl-3-methyl-5-hydroxy-6-metoxy-1,4-benzoquinol methylase
MLSPEPPRAAAAVPASASSQRWRELLDAVVSLLPARARWVLVDGATASCDLFAARLAAALAEGGRPRVELAGGARWRDTRSWDIVIWLRTAPGGRQQHADDGEGQEQRDREERADIVIDLHDQDWPVIRRVAARLAAGGEWYLTETRAFFACRAATWDTKFGDDLPAYTAAISEAGIPRGGVVLDIGCGSGRALPPLRQAVGPRGSVIAIDLTPEMLAVARQASISARAALVLADARSLPFADASTDAIFAAGLVDHLPDTEAGLRELARVTRQGGLLVLFHPSGRAALAARHGRALSPDEPLAEGMLRRSTAATGWKLTAYEDATHRFFAVAERC